MTTTRRWQALRWFADHAVDINSVAGTRMPSAKMRNTMLRDGQLLKLPVGQFKFNRYVLSDDGRELLAGKGKRRRKTPSIEEQLSEAIP